MKSGGSCPRGMCGDPVKLGEWPPGKRGAGKAATKGPRGGAGSGVQTGCAWTSARGQARQHRWGLQLLWVGGASGPPRSGNRDPIRPAGSQPPPPPFGVGPHSRGLAVGKVSQPHSCSPARPTSGQKCVSPSLMSPVPRDSPPPPAAAPRGGRSGFLSQVPNWLKSWGRT